MNIFGSLQSIVWCGWILRASSRRRIRACGVLEGPPNSFFDILGLYRRCMTRWACNVGGLVSDKPNDGGMGNSPSEGSYTPVCTRMDFHPALFAPAISDSGLSVSRQGPLSASHQYKLNGRTRRGTSNHVAARHVVSARLIKAITESV